MRGEALFSSKIGAYKQNIDLSSPDENFGYRGFIYTVFHKNCFILNLTPAILG